MSTLREMAEAPGRCVSVYLQSPSDVDGAEDRLDVRWRNARRELGDQGLDEDTLAELDEIVGTIAHDEGAAAGVIFRLGGPHLVEHLPDELVTDLATVDDVPRLGPLLASRQRSLPHLVVVADRTGADIVAFSGGEVAAVDSVEGETLHVQRSHPGGWSQRRFQQRAENRWESNSREVADAVESWAARIDAVLVVVAGDVRAVGFLLEHLAHDVRELTEVVEVGRADAVADAAVRLVADRVARRTVELLDELRSRSSAGRSCVGVEPTMEALAAGRVECLLVVDDVADDRRYTSPDGAPGGRLVDVAIQRALLTDADARVVPTIPDLTDGLGALLRW